MSFETGRREIRWQAREAEWGSSMKSSQKIKYNLLVGFGSQLLTILLGILVPRLTLVSYGSEVNGLLSSVLQIYSYIGLLEAGIGTATLQALYHTVGTDDHGKTNAILAATNRYYKRAGCFYVLAVLLFSCLYPLLVETEIPTGTVMLIILFNGVGTITSFFYQNKYLLLLQAEGKNYVETILTTLINVLRNVAKIVLMALGMDVLLVQTVSMLIGFVRVIYVSLYIRRHYDWIDLSVEPDFGSISQSKNVLVHQFSNLINNNTDVVLLTVFCDLKVVSVYSLFAMLFSMVSNAMTVFSDSVMFSLGQTFHADRKRFDQMYDAYELCYLALVFSLYSVALYFILPFVKCYTAGVTDINYLDPLVPMMMVMIHLLSYGRSAPNHVINIAGHFKKTQYRSVLESLINIVASVIAVQRWGIYGVLLGTIVSLVYRVNDMILYVSKQILLRSAWITYWRWFVNFAVFFALQHLSRQLTVKLDSYVSIVLFCIPYAICTLVIFLGIACATNPGTVKPLLRFARERFQKRS